MLWGCHAGDSKFAYITSYQKLPASKLFGLYENNKKKIPCTLYSDVYTQVTLKIAIAPNIPANRFSRAAGGRPATPRAAAQKDTRQHFVAIDCYQRRNVLEKHFYPGKDFVGKDPLHLPC